MGNSSSQTTNAEVLDSRVIKISESVAKKLFIQPHVGTRDNVTPKKEDSGSTVYLPEAPMPRPQSYREDGNYVDDALFQEFQKQEVMNELQIQTLQKKMVTAFEPFATESTRPGKAPVSSEQKRLAECFEGNKNASLKCHTEVLDFTSYTKQSSFIKDQP